MFSFKDKVVLVTGASSGIGAGTAVEFASRGASLAICGRNVDNLNKTKQACIEKGLPDSKVFMIQGDLSLESDTISTVQRAVDYFSKLDVLVISAGIVAPGSLETLSLEAYDKVMNINTRSVLHIIQLAIPHLVKTKGNIVNVSSVTGLRAFANVVAYNMSKAAADQLIRTAAVELGARGVRVNAVNPGVIVTEVHKRGGMSDEQYEKFLEHSKTTHALSRVGQVDEVTKAIVFLASDDASFITGVTLPIDGGRSQLCPR